MSHSPNVPVCVLSLQRPDSYKEVESPSGKQPESRGTARTVRVYRLFVIFCLKHTDKQHHPSVSTDR